MSDYEISHATYPDIIRTDSETSPAQWSGALTSGVLGLTVCLPFESGRRPASIRSDVEAGIFAKHSILEVTPKDNCPRLGKCSDCPNL